eukprot:gene5696-1018_t
MEPVSIRALVFQGLFAPAAMDLSNPSYATQVFVEDGIDAATFGTSQFETGSQDQDQPGPTSFAAAITSLTPTPDPYTAACIDCSPPASSGDELVGFAIGSMYLGMVLGNVAAGISLRLASTKVLMAASVGLYAASSIGSAFASGQIEPCKGQTSSASPAHVPITDTPDGSCVSLHSSPETDTNHISTAATTLGTFQPRQDDCGVPEDGLCQSDHPDSAPPQCPSRPLDHHHLSVPDPTQKQQGSGAWRAVSGVFSVYWVYRSAYIKGGCFCFCLQLVRSCRDAILPLVTMHVSDSNQMVGYVMFASYISDTALFWTSGILMDRFGRKYSAVPSIVIMGAGFLLFVFSTPLWLIFVVSVLFGLGNAFSSGVVMTIIADFAPDGQVRGQFIAGFRMVTYLGMLLGPSVLGVVSSSVSLGAAALAVAALAAFGALWGIFIMPETLQRRLDSYAVQTDEGDIPEVLDQELRSTASTPIHQNDEQCQ